MSKRFHGHHRPISGNSPKGGVSDTINPEYPTRVLVRSRKDDTLIAEFHVSKWGLAVFHDSEGYLRECCAKWDGSHESMCNIAALCGIRTDAPRARLRFCVCANKATTTDGVSRLEVSKNKSYRRHHMPLTATIGELIHV